MGAPPRWFLALIAARLELGPISIDEMARMMVESGRDWRYPRRTAEGRKPDRASRLMARRARSERSDSARALQ